MFLSITPFIQLNIHFILFNLIQLFLMKAWLIRDNWIESLYLKRTILHYFFYRDIELTYISTAIVKLVIMDRNDLFGNLKIDGYNNLERIVITCRSLMNIHSLSITNNPSLDSILCQSEACKYLLKLELSSVIDLTHFIWFTFLIYP